MKIELDFMEQTRLFICKTRRVERSVLSPFPAEDSHIWLAPKSMP